MSELPKILGQSAENPTGWRRYLPYIKSGKKFFLQRGTLLSLVILITIVLCAVRIIFDEEKPNTVSTIALDVNPVDIPTIDIPSATGQVSRQIIAGGGKKKAAVRYPGLEVITRPRDLSAIPPGSLCEARLVTGASNGLVRAEVTQNLVVGSDLTIPARCGACRYGQLHRGAAIYPVQPGGF